VGVVCEHTTRSSFINLLSAHASAYREALHISFNMSPQQRRQQQRQALNAGRLQCSQLSRWRDITATILGPAAAAAASPTAVVHNSSCT
jgi:hypothetical protein